MAAENSWSTIVPPAATQTSLEPDQVIHSGNAGLIIHRTAQLRNEFRSAGREFAREVAQHVNRTQADIATLLLYEEAFGVHDRIHWLIHMKSLSDYLMLMRMAATDEDFRQIFFKERIPAEKGGGDWSKMILDASVEECVLLPQHWKMFGTRTDKKSPGHERQTPNSPFMVPAVHQTSLSPDQILHSANAGIVIVRTAISRYEHRDSAREFARETADYINQKQVGTATVFLYEEAFGRQDRMHWLVHMDSLGSYESLMAFCDDDEGYRQVAYGDRLPGGGSWERMFLEGSFQETVLIPQHMGSSGTK